MPQNPEVFIDIACTRHAPFRSMKQRYHTIIRPRGRGLFIGWVEELPGALSSGRSVEECRRKLRESVQLLVETHRHDARERMDESCIRGSIQIQLPDDESAMQYA